MSHIRIITYDNFPYGGASANLLRYFSLSLSLEGNNVEVVMPTGNNYGKNIDSNVKRSGKVENVRFKHLAYLNHPQNFIGKALDIFLGFINTIGFILKESFKSELDIIIIYNTVFSRYLSIFLLSKILGKKLIVILPEFYEKPNTNFWSLARIKWTDFYLGIKYLSKYADGFFVASHYLKNYLEKERHILKPIYVLPNLMDPSLFQSENEKPFIENTITIGYTGTPTRKDGVVDLIKSFSLLHKKYDNTHLLIIGDVTNRGQSVLPPLIELASSLGVKDDITFTGLVAFSIIPNLINQCQILALTRPNGVFAEAGFPTKLGEYFACKKPVLITRVGDIPLYFDDCKEVKIVEPDNVESIFLGFEELINDPDLCSKLSKNSFEWMNKNLNFRNVSGMLSAFTKKVKILP